MSAKYPEIEKLGLKYFQVNESFCFYVEADNLEKLLREAHIMYRDSKTDNWYVSDFGRDVTHTAKLIGITELKRQPMKVEFETSFPLSEVTNYFENNHTFKGKKVRVTIEEVGE